MQPSNASLTNQDCNCHGSDSNDKELSLEQMKAKVELMLRDFPFTDELRRWPREQRLVVKSALDKLEDLYYDLEERIGEEL